MLVYYLNIIIEDIANIGKNIIDNIYLADTSFSL